MSARSTHVQVTCRDCDKTGWAHVGFTGWRCTQHRDETPDEQPEKRTQSDDDGPHAGSPYRCRAHHEVRVDQRGKGCGRCALERSPRKEPQLDPLVIR